MEHKTFKEKMSTMNRKEKVSYIIYYYKYHFIITLLIIASIVGFTVDRLNQKEIVFNASFIGATMNSTKLNKLNDEATNKLVSNKNKQEVSIDFKEINSKSVDQQTSANIQKLMAQLSVGELDVMVLPENLFKTYSKRGTFLSLENLKNDSNFKNLSFVKAQSSDKGESKTYGIDVSSLKVFKELSYTGSDKLIFAIPANTKHKSLSIKFIQWLITKNSI